MRHDLPACQIRSGWQKTSSKGHGSTLAPTAPYGRYRVDRKGESWRPSRVSGRWGPLPPIRKAPGTRSGRL